MGGSGGASVCSKRAKLGGETSMAIYSLAIEKTGEARMLEHTKELALKARQLKTRMLGQAWLRACVEHAIAKKKVLWCRYT